MLIYFIQKQPKRPRSPSRDLHLLSDSDFPEEETLDLPIIDNGNFDLDFFDYCYAEMEKELGQEALIEEEEEANALYGVSIYCVPRVLTVY